MINLEKGQRVSMDKGLTLVSVGLGWIPQPLTRTSTSTHQPSC